MIFVIRSSQQRTGRKGDQSRCWLWGWPAKAIFIRLLDVFTEKQEGINRLHSLIKFIYKHTSCLSCYNQLNTLSAPPLTILSAHTRVFSVLPSISLHRGASCKEPLRDGLKFTEWLPGGKWGRVMLFNFSQGEFWVEFKSSPGESHVICSWGNVNVV